MQYYDFLLEYVYHQLNYEYGSPILQSPQKSYPTVPSLEQQQDAEALTSHRRAVLFPNKPGGLRNYLSRY